MKPIDEYELDLMYERERRAERDHEREPVVARKRRPSRKPRYSRFRTLARINDAVVAEQAKVHEEKEAAWRRKTGVVLAGPTAMSYIRVREGSQGRLADDSPLEPNEAGAGTRCGEGSAESEPARRVGPGAVLGVAA